ncbi:Histidine kinase [Duganella sp. CF517]|uniref:sensor histidine kinase n=1 Tax=Duganella sp. CF517 TaxID=1881038 RepID=UPI0008BDF5F5|nr:sensor histidine kinase [Duganella sp. CF517]SEN51023.1 Histidine kinase [Duganella sp. CF517]
MKAGLLALLLLVSTPAVLPPALAAAGQTSDWQSNLYHRGWTKQDGAPSVGSGIAQDRSGMLWFTSSTGLYHFDGARFERTDVIDGNKLLSPTTSSVAAFGDALWVGYGFGGASVFERGTVRHYGVAQGLPGRTAHQFSRTADGTVWLATAGGLFWTQGERWNKVEEAAGLPPGFLFHCTALPDGTLLAHHAKGVYRSIAGTRRFRLVAPQATEMGRLRADGKVLMVSAQHKMWLYDPDSGAVTPLNWPADLIVPLSVTLDARGAIWIGTGQGMQLLGPDLRPLRTFAAPHQFTGKMAYTDLSDREGNLWFVTEEGVDRIRVARLNSIEMPPRMMGALNVVAGGDGTVWIGNTPTTGNFNDNSFTIGADGRRAATTLHNVTATLRDRDGAVWLATPGTIWRQQQGRMRRLPLPPALASKEVQALALGADGKLWVSVATYGVGTLADGVWTPGGGYPELAATAITMHVDERGRIWFGYPGNAMAVLEGGTVRRFGAADGIDVGNVLSMSSRGGRLWIGGDRGLAYLRGQRFVALGAADGVPLYGITGLVQSGAGELWLHGADGLARIGTAALADALRADARAVALERFDYLDGYQGQPSTIRPLNSLSEAPDGRIWYATSVAVGWIDPTRIFRNSLAPTPRVAALKTDGKAYVPRDGVSLPKHTDNLQIDFTAAALSIPERVRFRYRLLGLEGSWREAGGRRQAFYTNLGPGDYRFEVSAANEDGIWSVAPASLSFSIAPAPTQTVWFKLACAAACLAALYLLYLARLAQVTARIADRLRERVSERERIARTLHDTLLQSVQALILRFDSIKRLLPYDAPAQQQIDTALDAAQAVIDEGRDEVMELRAVAATSAALLEPALRAAWTALAADGMAFALTVSGRPRALRAAASAEALAIGKEALSNAARHSGGAAVQAELAYSSKHFRLTVADDGAGIDATVLRDGKRPGHWGLEGMRERAQRVGGKLTLDSTAGAGTRVTLMLTSRQAYE